MCGLRVLFSAVGFGGARIFDKRGGPSRKGPSFSSGLVVMVAIKQASQGAGGAG